MIRLRLFAQAREAAGTALAELDPADHATLADVLAAARERFGPDFAAVLDRSRVWVNGDDPPSGPTSPLRAGDEVAVLPPVSGGTDAPGGRRY